MNYSPTILDFNVREMSRAPAARGSSMSVVWFLAASCWLLMLMSFSPPGERESTANALDTVAIAKLAMRLVVFCSLSLLTLRQWSTARRKLVTRLLLPWIAFAGWSVLSVGWSPLKNVSLGQAGSFAVLLLLAHNVALRTELRTFEHLLKQLTLALLMACLLLLAIYVTLPSWGCLTRGTRGLMHATCGAATASIGCTLLLAARLLFGWKWSRVLLWPGIGVFGATLVLAQNRTALGLMCLIVIGLAASVAPLWRALVLAGCGIGGAVYLAVDLQLGLTDAIFDVLAHYLSRGQTTAQLTQLSGREEMWTAMWNSFLESPWIGHGYFVSSSTGKIYVWYLANNWTAHNFWLQILVSTGLVGGVLMAWGLVTLAARLLRSVARRDIDWRYGVLFGSVLVWQVVWGINNESYVGPLQPESVVFFAILGLATGGFADAIISRHNTRLSALRATS